MSLATTGAGRSKGQNAASIDLTSLAAYYSFNSGLTTDDSGNGNTLSVVGKASRGVGSIHEGADFKTDDALTIAGASAGALNLGDIGFTICCRVRLDTNAASQGILGKYLTTGNQRGYRLFYITAPTNLFRVQISADGVTITTLDLANGGAPVVGQSHAIIIWYDPVADTIYAQVDGGTLDSAAHSGGAFVNTSSFDIGQFAGGVTRLDGMVDEVGVFKRLWTPAERAAYTDGITYPFAALTVKSDTVISTYVDSGGEAFPVRVPHQRQCFYAAGLYWMFFCMYNSGIDLRHTSTADGKIWGPTLSIGSVPIADAGWDVHYDPSANVVHVVKPIQTGGIIFQDGLYYRRGTTNANGTIAWDADWQTAIAVGQPCGDGKLIVGTDGAVWFGQSNLDAYIHKNTAVDGTWSEPAGFPVQLTATGDLRVPIVAPLAAGGVYAVVYQYGTETQALGYYSDGSSTFNADGAITVSNVEVTSVGSAVSCIDAGGLGDGVVHICYITSAGAVMYRQRSALGIWAAEVTLSDNSRVTAAESSPRISFGAAGEIYVTWSDSANDCIWLAKYNGAAWASPVQIVSSANVRAEHEHIMPAERANGSVLPLVHYDDDELQRFILCNV